MNALERNQIGAPDSRIEDSAFFCYISNLSPIKPARPIHITETVKSLTFASVPPVFTSPHLKEWRILRRHNLPDLSKPDFCGNGDEANRLNTSEDVLDSVQVLDCPSLHESFDPGFSIGEVIVPSNGTSNLATDSNLPHGSTDDLQKTQPMGLADSCEEHQMEDTESESEAVIVPSNGTPNLLTDLLNYLKYDYESEGICQVDQNKDEGAGCDGENSISDASNLLIFDTSIEAESLKEQILELVHHEIGSFASLESNLPHGSTDDLQKTLPMGLADSCEEHQMEDTESESEAVIVPSNGTPNLLTDLLNYLKYDYESEGICQVDQNKDEGAGCDRENSISDASDLLSFDTFIEAESLKEQILELVHHEIGSFASPESNLPHGSPDDLQKTLPMGLADSCEEHQMEDTESESEAVIVPSNGTPNLATDLLSYLKYDYGSLDCNRVPSHGNNIDLLPDVNRSPISPFHFDQEVSEERQHSFESEIDIQGIRVDQNKDEGASSLSLNSVGLQIFSADNGSLVGQGASKEFKFGANEEFNLSSPKKKKRKLEIFGESEACKRCSCKKSKCLKLYCECFAAGMYCMDSCSCQECFNKPIHEDTVMATRKQIESRNPLAFAPKVSRRSEPVQGIEDEFNKTSSSARHKRGCNCKKSSCQKKYCECYQGGVGCSINCRCEGCKNEFGLNPSLAKDILAPSDYRACGSGSLSVGLAGRVTSLPGVSHFSPEAMYCSYATNSYFPKSSTSRAPIHCCTTSVPNCAVWEHSAAGVGALGGMPLEGAMWVDLVEGCNLGASQWENCNKLDGA